MTKLPYKKPEITIVELNEEIVMASGPCIDHTICLGIDCPTKGCSSVCDPDASCHIDA